MKIGDWIITTKRYAKYNPESQNRMGIIIKTDIGLGINVRFHGNKHVSFFALATRGNTWKIKHYSKNLKLFKLIGALDE